MIGSEPDSFCDALCRDRPAWVVGSLSHAETRFLFRQALQAEAELAVEVGTASGFSTTVLCHALNFLSVAGRIRSDFRVVSYDAATQFYADQTRSVGAVAEEILPTSLLEHIAFENPATAVRISRDHEEDSIRFLFLDANHGHPWPTLDVLAVLDSLAPEAVVVLHDINLPLLHPEFDAWGVKTLFDELDVQKEVPEGERTPNIGSVRVPEDKDELRDQLLRILVAHPWEVEVGDDVTTAALA